MKHTIILTLPLATLLLASCSTSFVIGPGSYSPLYNGGHHDKYYGEISPTGQVTERYITSDDGERQFNDKPAKSVSRTATHAFDSRIDAILDMAQEGYVVTCTADGSLTGDTLTGDTVETVVFSTPERSEAKRWAQRMSRRGYAITVSYDKQQRTYTCTARRRKSR